jgi:hypothetical protein
VGLALIKPVPAATNYRELKMKGYKTILAGAAVTLLGLLEGLDIVAIIPDKYDELALAIVGALMVALRLITDTPVGKKDAE